LQLKSLAEIFEERLGVATLGSARIQEEKTFERKLGIVHPLKLSGVDHSIDHILQKFLYAT